MNPTTKLADAALFVHPYNVWDPKLYYHVVQTSGPANLITMAGQVGIRPDGEVPDDRTEQMKQAFTNVQRCLDAAGANIGDIIKVVYYVVNYDHTDREPVNLLKEFLNGHKPPITLIPVPRLAGPKLVIEVDVTAAIPQAPRERYDVVVVGAGLSGLQTARDLHKAGLTVKVLEARDRVGGKTYSWPAQKSICDVGAAWINDTNQSKMFALAQRYGLDLIVQNTKGNIICDDGIGELKTHPYGQLLSNDNDKEAIEDVKRIRDIFEAGCQQIDITSPVASGKRLRTDLDDITFEEWIRSQGPFREDAMNALKTGTRAMLGVEPNEMSALFFLDYCKSGGGYMLMRSDTKDGGQYLRVAQGTQSFSRGLANELPPGAIAFSSPVRAIEQTAGGVRVVSAKGVYDASRVVVSVPTPLYKEIAFDPSLPPEKMRLTDSSRLGDYCKSILFYRTPWWRQSNLCGLSQSVHGPFAVTRDSSVDADGHYSLTCFVVGQPARDWMKLARQERDKAVMDQVRRVFGKFANVEGPIEIVEQIWKNEQWSQGCPCPAMIPGALTEFEHVLRAPFGRVHFVGTETAYEWKGYMEGAVRSGERGAEEVLRATKDTKL